MKRAGALAKLANHLAKRHPEFAAVGVGIGPTKTLAKLAKLANHLAKRQGADALPARPSPGQRSETMKPYGC